MSCGVGRRHGLVPILLWLWLAAVASTGPLAWEISICCRCGPKKEKEKKKKKKKDLGSPPESQKFKDPGLSLLWPGFDLWLGNFCMPWVQPKKKKNGT